MRRARAWRGDGARSAQRAGSRTQARVVRAMLAIALVMAAGCAEHREGGDAGTVAQESTQERGPLRVRVSLDRDAITVVESVRVRLDVSVESGYRAELLGLEAMLAGARRTEEPARQAGSLGAFTVADVVRTGAALARDGRIESSITLTLEAYLPGEHEIPEFVVVARQIEGGDVQEIRTRAMPVSVASVLESDDLTLVPLRDVVDPRVEFRVPITGIVVAGLIGSGLIAGIVLIGRRLIMAPAEVSPIEAARERLETIVKRAHEDPLERAASLREASLLLRQCMAYRADPRAMRMGDEELARSMPRWNSLDASDQAALLAIVRDLDRALYSGEEPSPERTRRIIRGVIEQLGVIDRVGMRFALADRAEEGDALAPAEGGSSASRGGGSQDGGERA